MISHMHLKAIVNVLQKPQKGSRLLLLVGDFLQLQPVGAAMLCDNPTSLDPTALSEHLSMAHDGYELFRNATRCTLSLDPEFSR